MGRETAGDTKRSWLFHALVPLVVVLLFCLAVGGLWMLWEGPGFYFTYKSVRIGEDWSDVEARFSKLRPRGVLRCEARLHRRWAHPDAPLMYDVSGRSGWQYCFYLNGHNRVKYKVRWLD